MLGFGKKKEDPNRKALRKEFESVTQALRQADAVVQIAVGHAINMANSIFHQAYNSPSEFQALPKPQQIEYINKLTNMEVGLREEKNDPHSSIGFGLFKMWVGAVSENDTELMNQFSSELAHFSRKGDLGV